MTPAPNDHGCRLLPWSYCESNNLKPRSPWRQQDGGRGGAGVGMATEKLQGLIGLSVDITHLDGGGLPQCKPTQVSILSSREMDQKASALKSTILKKYRT